MSRTQQKQDKDPTPPGADVPPVGETGRKHTGKMILDNQIHENTKRVIGGRGARFITF